MRALLVIALALALAGCFEDTNITLVVTQAAIKACEAHGGLQYFESQTFNDGHIRVTATCVQADVTVRVPRK